ncbi:MAG TPA: hypothetical protein VF748_06320 [Candidatus Acidoferrum sp.]
MRGSVPKPFLCLTLLLFTFSASAQAQEAVPLARGNTPGEPHHHLKIENEYVRVYYVEAPPREATLLHQHDHDYIYVSLGPADVINAALSKPPIHLQLKDGETHFTRGGFAHIVRNLADTPFRNVTVELLKPQGEAHNECGFVIPGQGAAICDPPFVPIWDDTQFETTESRLDLVWIFSSVKPLKKEDQTTASKQAFLVVGLGSPEVTINVKGEPAKTLHAGEVRWFDPGSDVQFSCEGCTGQFLKLTFKDSARIAKP